MDVLSDTHSLPCVFELARYHFGVIPLTKVPGQDSISQISHAINQGQLELCIQQDIDAIVARFKQVDITRKVAIKSKLHEIAYPDMTSVSSS